MNNTLNNSDLCNLCPRLCNISRKNGILGYCKLPYETYVTRASLHLWEEPIISGVNGSGTIFFTGCNLKCVFCQNEALNYGLNGTKLSINELADLLSDNNDCSIKVVRFLGKDKTQMYSRDEFGYQCLLVAMKKALEFVLPYNETKVDLSHPVREEIKLFDEDCLREAWYNACLHTRWDKMIPPAIYIFSDRIEIISTGGLPVDFPVEDFYKGISHPINRKLQQIMGQLDFVEQTGHGVPQIVTHYGKEAFEINEHYINVVLKFPFNSTKLSNSYSVLSGKLKDLYIAMSNNSNASAEDYAKIIDVSVSTVNNYIKELKDLGKIERVGSNKSGYWKVN